MTAPAVATAGASALATLPAGPAVHLDPGQLIAKAIEHAVPVETLERLLAMRASLVEESARAAFFAALSAFRARVPPIPKRQTASVATRTGGRFTYHYADLGDILTAIGPALADLGLSVTFDTALAEGMLRVTALVHHAAGHSAASTFAVPLATETRMSPAQAMGSALTYARRYALCAALGIVTAEDDDDGQSSDVPTATVPQRDPSGAPGAGQPPAVPNCPGPISEAQHRVLEARIAALGLDRERVKVWVLRAWNIAHLTEIPANRFDALLGRLAIWADSTREAREERAAIQQEAGIPPATAAWMQDYDHACR
jgi:hypothetical protein